MNCPRCHSVMTIHTDGETEGRMLSRRSANTLCIHCGYGLDRHAQVESVRNHLILNHSLGGLA